MLWLRGDLMPTSLTILGTWDRRVSTDWFCAAFGLMVLGVSRIDLRSVVAAAFGSFAAIIALTIATPSSPFFGDFDWNITRCTFEALSPPIATVGIFWSMVERRWRMFLTPAVPMMDFVFSFVGVA